jgi:glycosyltransferase involved in cell wall biosynthesis
MSTYPLVSVVIPVFNEEKYLSQCIKSVLNQTYKNFECIILNNCSTDNSIVIARQYEANDKRIKVYENKEFLSMMENHNNSLKYISKSSKYCKMVLGDDWLFKDCIEKMVEVAETDPNIGIVGSYHICGNRLEGHGLPIIENSDGKYIFDGTYVCRLQLLSGNIYFFGSQSTVLYNSEAIRKKSKFFDETSIVADAEVCYEILENKKFGYIYQVLSFTRMENISYTNSMLKYAAWLAGKMRIISKHGKKYLNNEEYNKMYKNVYEDYYSYLGWKIFTEKDNKFWEFHKTELGKINIKIKKIKLYYCAFLYLIDKILNPKRTFEEIINRKKRSLGLISNRNKIS